MLLPPQSTDQSIQNPPITLHTNTPQLTDPQPTCNAFSMERYESLRPVYFPTTATRTGGSAASSTVAAICSHCRSRALSSFKGNGEGPLPLPLVVVVGGRCSSCFCSCCWVVVVGGWVGRWMKSEAAMNVYMISHTPLLTHRHTHTHPNTHKHTHTLGGGRGARTDAGHEKQQRPHPNTRTKTPTHPPTHGMRRRSSTDRCSPCSLSSKGTRKVVGTSCTETTCSGGT